MLDIYDNKDDGQHYASTFLRSIDCFVPGIASAGGLFLDIGCGKAHFLKGLQDLAPHWKVYGLDVDREVLSEARKVYPSSMLTLADGSYLPYRDGSFSAVFTKSILDYSGTRRDEKDRLKYFPLTFSLEILAPELYRVLQPPGIYFCFEKCSRQEREIVCSSGLHLVKENYLSQKPKVTHALLYRI